MSAITWDAQGEHFYQTGVDHGVVYPTWDPTNATYTGGAFTGGVAWNGLTAVNESPSGAEPSPVYADNVKYLNLISAEEYAATIEALMYPDEFAECNGMKVVANGVKIGQQPRKPFGFVYRSLVGNDTEGTNAGYILHLIYNCTASPSEQSHETVNESPDASPLSFEVSTTPVAVTGNKPSATLEIDSRTANSTKLTALEKILFGDTNTDPALPLPDYIINMMSQQ